MNSLTFCEKKDSRSCSVIVQAVFQCKYFLSAVAYTVFAFEDGDDDVNTLPWFNTYMYQEKQSFCEWS